MAGDPRRPRIFIDADVLFAGSASPTEHSASLVLLRMAEITLIEAIASTQVVTEAERNLRAKIPLALPAFQLLVSRCLREVPDPALDEIKALTGLVDPDDAPILAAAVRENCPYLATFNVRHYQPGVKSVSAFKPGDLVQHIRYLLSEL
ncbi:MAG: PIN domain-containing protein [Chloroflexota bacterium]